MGYEGKRILIAGFGRSGIAAFDALAHRGASLAVYDDRDIKAEEPTLFERLAEIHADTYLGGMPVPEVKWDLLVLSPGVSPMLPFVQSAAHSGAEIIGELELSYRLGGGRYVAITGTNGKTTTTALTGAIFAAAGLSAAIAGNIGIPVVSEALMADANTWLVTEVSSFQLETTALFCPKIAAFLNLTPDHLDRHQTMEGYAAAKAKIFANQNEADTFIYNADDALVCALAETACSKKIPFSRKRSLAVGVFARDGKILFAPAENAEPVFVAFTNELRIPGEHNIENALAATAIALAAGIEPDIVAETLRSFPGVEHRIELVADLEGVRFVNDSKGTNPDAAIKAIEAIGGDILLIAGGYDKHADFSDYIRAAKGRVKKLLVLGATGGKIKTLAEAEGLEVFQVSGMEEAVRIGFELAVPGDTVLLSPACASWDMYRDFEQRGAHFKEMVGRLGGEK